VGGRGGMRIFLNMGNERLAAQSTLKFMTRESSVCSAYHVWSTLRGC
jgi:hypothetical protein